MVFVVYSLEEEQTNTETLHRILQKQTPPHRISSSGGVKASPSEANAEGDSHRPWMFRSVSANGSSRSEIVRHTRFDKESEGTHEAIFRAGSHLHRPLARCGKVRAQRRDGVRRFDIGLTLCGAHRPLKGGSSCGIDIEASVLPNTVGQSERKPYVIDPLSFLYAPFVESTFKLRVQTRVAHSGAEEPPLPELFSQ